MCEVGTSQAPTRTFGQCVQRAGKAVVWHMLSGSHESAISRGQHRLRAIQHDTFMRAQTKSSQVASQVKSSQVKSSQGDEVTEGDENVSMQRAGGGQRLNRRHQEEKVEEKVKDREVPEAAARW